MIFFYDKVKYLSIFLNIIDICDWINIICLNIELKVLNKIVDIFFVIL